MATSAQLREQIAAGRWDGPLAALYGTAPQELARRIEEVLGDEALRRRMVADGRAWVARFEPEVIASELLSTYRKVLAL